MEGVIIVSFEQNQIPCMCMNVWSLAILEGGWGGLCRAAERLFTLREILRIKPAPIQSPVSGSHAVERVGSLYPRSVVDDHQFPSDVESFFASFDDPLSDEHLFARAPILPASVSQFFSISSADCIGHKAHSQKITGDWQSGIYAGKTGKRSWRSSLQ